MSASTMSLEASTTSIGVAPVVSGSVSQLENFLAYYRTKLSKPALIS
jgi:hypothetical protein